VTFSIGRYFNPQSLGPIPAWNNQTRNVDEFNYLQHLRCSTALSLINNPISHQPSYWDIVIRKFPRLKMLDEIDVSVKQSVQAEVQPQWTRPAVAWKSVQPDLDSNRTVFGKSKSRGSRRKGSERSQRVVGDDSNTPAVVLS
jgi:hypothetical protein